MASCHSGASTDAPSSVPEGQGQRLCLFTEVTHTGHHPLTRPTETSGSSSIPPPLVTRQPSRFPARLTLPASWTCSRCVPAWNVLPTSPHPDVPPHSPGLCSCLYLSLFPSLFTLPPLRASEPRSGSSSLVGKPLATSSLSSTWKGFAIPSLSSCFAVTTSRHFLCLWLCGRGHACFRSQASK